ncbi:MAG: class IV adenylate cyclase [Burkholderiales bacterium]|nr:class IV adenylate cyclase [Phycisphaerae bacterium]
MAVEIEAKMKVANFDEIRAKLTSVGATKTGEYFEINTFFDTKDRSMLAADQGLRLRVKRNDADNTETYVCTYKGPRQHGKLKSREEIEMSVVNPKDTVAFFAALGYEHVLTFEKRRHSWKFQRCFIELDELPHLGVYIEIEGPDETTVFRIREALGLNNAPIIKTSYTAMLMNYLQERGRPDRSVMFPMDA